MTELRDAAKNIKNNAYLRVRLAWERILHIRTPDGVGLCSGRLELTQLGFRGSPAPGSGSSDALPAAFR